MKKLDERKNYQSIEKNATVVDVNPMDEKAIRQYISQTIESEGYTIRSDAFDLLLQLTDLNLSKLWENYRSCIYMPLKRRQLHEVRFKN